MKHARFIKKLRSKLRKRQKRSAATRKFPKMKDSNSTKAERKSQGEGRAAVNNPINKPFS